MPAEIKKELWRTVIFVLFVFSVINLIVTFVYATPIGPTVIIWGNTTKNATQSTKVNASINGTLTPGGYIFTAGLTSIQKNSRWKAYVGNVTGTLVLDDADDNTIFQWSLGTSFSGNVLATRASGNINWSGINCTWIYEGSRRYNESNRSAEEAENAALSHTSKNDNITATFSKANHSSIQIGGITIGKNDCFSLQTRQKDNEQVFSDSNNANFTEVILYDAAFNKSGGNIVYQTKIENDITGYRSDSTYDFQMMLPENGLASWASSTAYYFYVELT